MNRYHKLCIIVLLTIPFITFGQGIISRPEVSPTPKVTENKRKQTTTNKATDLSLISIVNSFISNKSWQCLAQYNDYLWTDGRVLHDTEFGSYGIGYEIPLYVNGSPLFKDPAGRVQKWAISMYGPAAYVEAMEIDALIEYGDLYTLIDKIVKSLGANLLYYKKDIYKYRLNTGFMAIYCSKRLMEVL